MAVKQQRESGLSRSSASSDGRSFLKGRVPPPLTPPHKGEGEWPAARPYAITGRETPTLAPPSPLWGGVRGGGTALREDIQRRRGNLPGTGPHPRQGDHPWRENPRAPRPHHPANPRTHTATVST
jgi:hypothetical protein